MTTVARPRSYLECLSVCLMLSCSGTPPDNSNGTGTSVGGASSDGGATSTGGQASVAGNSAMAGNPAAGGSPSTGGAATEGGSYSTGGSPSTAGAISTGGNSSIAGAVSTGGQASAGTAATGGANATAATGGAAATGGTTAIACTPQGNAIDISGTINNTSAVPGRAYIALGYPDSPSAIAGTSLLLGAGETRNFVLHDGTNLSGSFLLSAHLDTTGTGVPSVVEPGASTTIQLNNTDLTSVALTLQVSAPSAPPAPSFNVIIPTANAAVVAFKHVTNPLHVDLADKYRLYYTKDLAGGPAGPAHFDGAVTIPLDATATIISNLISGTTYSMALTAVAGTLEGPASPAQTVTIGVSNTGYTVSGVASLAGLPLTASSRLVSVLYSPSGGIFASITPATASTAYSIAGVTADTYGQLAFLDLDGDGNMSQVEPHLNMQSPSMISVTSSVTDANYAVPSGRVTATVNTGYEPQGPRYEVGMRVTPNTSLPVNVTLCSGPNVATPSDLGIETDSDLTYNTFVALPTGVTPAVNDTYGFKVSFADGSEEYVQAQVTAVLTADVQMLGPVGTVHTTAPVFTWSVSEALPATYRQELQVYSNTGNIWDYRQFGSTIRSVTYNEDGNAQLATLVNGTAYEWNLRISDELGNVIQVGSVQFTPMP